MWIKKREDLNCIIDMYDVTCIEGQESARMSELIRRIKQELRKTREELEGIETLRRIKQELRKTREELERIETWYDNEYPMDRYMGSEEEEEKDDE